MNQKLRRIKEEFREEELGEAEQGDLQLSQRPGALWAQPGLHANQAPPQEENGEGKGAKSTGDWKGQVLGVLEPLPPPLEGGLIAHPRQVHQPLLEKGTGASKLIPHWIFASNNHWRAAGC